MAKANITKRAVDAAIPGTKTYFLWDEKVAGFGLKVTPAGSKAYVFQYRLAAPGKADATAPARYTIGKHGNLTPDQARKRAQDLAVLVAQNIDPRELEAETRAARDEEARKASEKTKLEAELAFSRIVDLWLLDYAAGDERRPASIRQAKLIANNYLKPALGAKPIPHVQRHDLQLIIDNIPASKKAMRRAVFTYASVLFGWAVERGSIATNPLADMKKPPAPKSRDRVLENGELIAVWAAAKTLGDLWGAFYRLALLTGQRREEVAALRWSELDRSNMEWVIPSDRTKNGVAHIVPLSRTVVEELDRLAGSATWPKSGYVLTTTGRTPISGFSKAKKALDSLIAGARSEGALPAWRVHDLRRTVATGFQKLGVRFEVTEAVLNHISGAKGGVAGIYQRHDWKDEKKAALSAWATYISELIKDASCENEAVIEEMAE